MTPFPRWVGPSPFSRDVIENRFYGIPWNRCLISVCGGRGGSLRGLLEVPSALLSLKTIVSCMTEYERSLMGTQEEANEQEKKRGGCWRQGTFGRCSLSPMDWCLGRTNGRGTNPDDALFSSAPISSYLSLCRGMAWVLFLVWLVWRELLLQREFLRFALLS